MARMQRIVLASTVGLAVALTWPAAAMAASHVTLTLAGGKPPVTAPLAVQSYAWGTSIGSRTGGYTGRTQVKSGSVSGGEFSVTIALDKSLTKLAQDMVDGSHFDTATVSMTHVPDPSPYLEIVFSQVSVASVELGSAQAGNQTTPTIHLTFAYNNVELHYRAESTCSLGSKSWENLSHVTPAADPATGGSATDTLQPFLPVQLGSAGPGAVDVTDPSQADTLLGANGPNGIANLRAQALATRLNVGSGALDPALVSSELSQADALLGADKPSSWGTLDPSTQASIEQLVTQLQSANAPGAGCPLLPQAAHLVTPTPFSLAGVVTDACTGAPVTGLSANLTAPGLPGPISLMTNHSEFAGANLPAGAYQLTVTGGGHNTFTLPAIQIPYAGQQPPLAGAFTGGVDIAIAMTPPGGCAPSSKDPGPVRLQALTGTLFDQCSLQALTGGTASLVPPAGGSIGADMLENGFSLAELAPGSYGFSESVPGYQPILLNGGTLPAVQMPAQPSPLPDGSGARFSIIVVAEPAPLGAAC